MDRTPNCQQGGQGYEQGGERAGGLHAVVGAGRAPLGRGKDDSGFGKRWRVDRGVEVVEPEGKVGVAWRLGSRVRRRRALWSPVGRRLETAIPMARHHLRARTILRQLFSAHVYRPGSLMKGANALLAGYRSPEHAVEAHGFLAPKALLTRPRREKS